MVAEHMKEELVEMREAGKSSTLFHEAVSYVATMCTTLMDRHCFDPAEWGTCFTPFLGPFVGGVAKQACEYAPSPLSPPDPAVGKALPTCLFSCPRTSNASPLFMRCAQLLVCFRARTAWGCLVWGTG